MEQKIPKSYDAWIFRKRPVNEVVSEKHVEWKKVDIPESLPEGSVLLKIEAISYDASQQIRAIGSNTNYFTMDLDVPFQALSIGKIVKSNNEKYQVGKRFQFSGHWGEYILLEKEKLTTFFFPVPDHVDAVDFMVVGALSTGITAYYGLKHVCRDNLKPGKTLVVSAATGGVGQMVIQLAQQEGLRVVAISGGEEKKKYLLSHFKVDAAVDYKSKNFAAELKEACPNKVDIYFDNTGGEISDQVFANLNDNARIALCGLIESYVGSGAQNFKNFASILITRSRLEGFMAGRDDPSLVAEGSKKLAEYLGKGILKMERTEVSLKDAPNAFAKLFSDNDSKKGKLVIRL